MTTPELKEEIKDLKAENKELEKKLSEKQSFSSDMIRLFVGFVAFWLPILISILALTPRLSSISASYHTTAVARDVYVGLLGILGFCLIVYQGNSLPENIVASIGGIAAWFAAIFPTACDRCSPMEPTPIIHMIAGITLFSVVGFICLWFFRKAANDKAVKDPKWEKAKRRSTWYIVLGSLIWIVLGLSIIFGVLSFLKIITDTSMETFPPIFLGEFAMLWLFCTAWSIAAKYMPYFVDEIRDIQEDKDENRDKIYYFLKKISDAIQKLMPKKEVIKPTRK